MDIFFSTLKVSCHCFLTCIVSDKMSITILFFISLYILFLFLDYFYFFFFPLPSDYFCFFVTCFHQFSWVLVWFSLYSSTYGLLSFLNLWVYSSHHIWNNVNCYFFKNSSPTPPPFLLFWDSNFTYVRPPDIGWLVTHWCSLFSSLLFPLCFILNSSYCYSSSLMFSLVLFNLLLILFKMFFILDTFHF